MMIGSTLLVALGAMACRDPDEPVDVHTPDRTGAPSTESSDERPGTPPATEADQPLRRPKPSVPLSVTPPPTKPP